MWLPFTSLFEEQMPQLLRSRVWPQLRWTKVTNTSQTKAIDLRGRLINISWRRSFSLNQALLDFFHSKHKCALSLRPDWVWIWQVIYLRHGRLRCLGNCEPYALCSVLYVFSYEGPQLNATKVKRVLFTILCKISYYFSWQPIQSSAPELYINPFRTTFARRLWIQGILFKPGLEWRLNALQSVPLSIFTFPIKPSMTWIIYKLFYRVTKEFEVFCLQG